MKTNLTEYVNNKFIKPKEIKDLVNPSKEKTVKGDDKSVKNNCLILSYIREKDNFVENKNMPSSLKISVKREKKSIRYSQIQEEKWISTAEINNFNKKEASL